MPEITVMDGEGVIVVAEVDGPAVMLRVGDDVSFHAVTLTPEQARIVGVELINHGDDIDAKAGR